MANLTEYLTTKYNRMVGEITKDLSDQLDRVVELGNMIRALKNSDMPVNGGPLTLDRIQVMEDGNFRILPMPPAPADTCTEEVSKEFGKKNGKKDESEAAGAVSEAVGAVSDAT